MDKKLTWSMLTLPPINLKTMPKQDRDYKVNKGEITAELERNMQSWMRFRAIEKACDLLRIEAIGEKCKLDIQQEKNVAKLKQLNFLYFCRTGRYPDES